MVMAKTITPFLEVSNYGEPGAVAHSLLCTVVCRLYSLLSFLFSSTLGIPDKIQKFRKS
jgi:hypothetical protein